MFTAVTLFDAPNRVKVTTASVKECCSQELRSESLYDAMEACHFIIRLPFFLDTERS